MTKSKLISVVYFILFVVVLCLTAYLAYDVRLYAIREIWDGIHEFDPWFNFRASKYLLKHGMKEFFHWYDHESWYPIGRPIGTTIYPGLQIASVFIYKVLKSFGSEMTLNQVCVYFPAWFGSVATIFLGLLSSECTGSLFAGAASAFVMSIIPAHVMRSVGGGFDNECLAISLMCSTWYFWVRSLRKSSDKSKKEPATIGVWFFGILAGLSSVAMAAAWGGYVFVVNMIGIHGLVLIILRMGRYSTKLHVSYSLWYVIHIAGSVCIPVIGWTPLRSMEQLLPLAVFVFLQITALGEWGANRKSLKKTEKKETLEKDKDYSMRKRKKTSSSVFSIFSLFGGRIQVILCCLTVAVLIFGVIYSTGFFSPVSIRVSSLFIEHTRTGNPLVDSVAEHQPTSQQMYNVYLGVTANFAPFALLFCLFHRHDAKYFLILLAVISYYFSHKMNRLIILTGAPASILTGYFMATCWKWALDQPWLILKGFGSKQESEEPPKTEDDKANQKRKTKKGKKARKRKKKKKKEIPLFYRIKNEVNEKAQVFTYIYNSYFGYIFRVLAIILIMFVSYNKLPIFYHTSRTFAIQTSNPQLVFKAKMRDGSQMIVDDYLLAYEWLRDNTPTDSRVLSWWDYGYQITGVGERTSLADGNTWNLEHIAFIGKMLTSPQKQAHATARHVADYVLVWSGGGGDDLAKSPHIARIASSVYDICGRHDPLCRSFGFSQDPKTKARIPSKTMRESLLYNLIMNRRQNDAKVDSKLFQEVFMSKHGLVRIYKIQNVSKKSKKWAANPENWICDSPGSWYCVGQYPPAVKSPPKTHRNIHYDKNGNPITT